MNELRDRKQKLNEAFVFKQALTREDYEQMRDALNDEVADAEVNLAQARMDEIDIHS